MEGAAGLPRQLKLEPGITREMRTCGMTQVRQTEERKRDGEEEEKKSTAYTTVINKKTPRRVFLFKS